ncbi:hypothetical protein L861_05850 [Litchfieldella anticariensis FP35 = DSM 16096]|uniref:Uncharacterized protein n=1 Tax=Litchfieldella anticariensis (strain DSM 16096 / CECT 5854 / CIP 108499 / LMG 22089 / FP35) TaxID=1121939 RepID=S2KKI0_LITA3|nr:hypothetical protein L861_05850 [Halomonas anticariensis FP35 = DSM 16096]
MPSIGDEGVIGIAECFTAYALEAHTSAMPQQRPPREC